MRHYDYHRPASLAEALRLKQSLTGSCFIAGGTDVMVRIRHQALRPAALISLRGVPGLAGVTPGDPTRVGALTTMADLARDPVLLAQHPVLCQAARCVGSAQIRNAATLGGNLGNASPCADTAPALLVLDARAELGGLATRREVPLERFFLAPGITCLERDEVLSAILLPAPAPGTRALFLKKGRVRMDLAQASVAVALVLEGDRCVRARLAAGAVAPTPLRLTGVEALLEGARLGPGLIADAQALAGRAVAPITDLRASEAYRRRIVGVFVRRALETLLAQSQESRS